MSHPSFVLRITRANQAPSETEYTQAKLTVGREVGDIALRDPGSSSKHAEILFADGIVKLRDVGSTNGTWVGPRKVADEVMTPGVVYTMGGSTIELVAVKGVEPVRTMVMPGPKGSGTAVQQGTAIQPRPEAPKPATPVVGTSSSSSSAGMSAQQRKNLLIGGVAVAVGLGLFFAFRGGSEPTTGGGGKSAVTAKLTAQREAQV